MILVEKFFVAPDACLLEVPITHILAVLREPERFGTTRVQTLAAYDAFGERWGLEGHAREFILADVLRRGWIRARFEPALDRIVVQLDVWEERRMGQIARLLESLRDRLTSETELCVLDLAGIAAQKTARDVVQSRRIKPTSP